MAELEPGVYERLITAGLDRQLRGLAADLVERDRLDPADADVVLARHLGFLARRALRSLPDRAKGDDRDLIDRQVEMANRIAAMILDAAPEVTAGAGAGADLVAAGEELREILQRTGAPGPPLALARPEVPLSTSALLVNGRDQPRIGSEVQRELASADRADLLCAFVKWQGLRVLDEQLADLVRRRRAAGEPAPPLRVITTTYIGATERRALDRLVELGAHVKVSYETRMTRLHAKAWLFHRATGFSTAYVGSSNLSKSALLDGLEWNVRVAEVEQGHLLDTFRATFDEYWEDPAFESYDPTDASQRDRLDEALAAEGSSGPADLPIQLTSLDVRPWGYQREILDELAAEREVHDRRRNLVVMATGTGKTVVAGLDYRRLHAAGEVDSVLFVAHRDEILVQSQSTFRHIMRDGSFGERFVGGERPSAWRHVFASVQSLARLDLADLDPGRFDMVVVDEFHHAGPETKTYARLLDHLRPKVLLGLTATPERADGQDILGWFGGRIAVELRLWEALERNLLAPFQYFGVHDGTDLSTVRWKRGTGYLPAELTNVYTAHEMRVRIILRTLQHKVADLGRMRALGFCVSIDHAEFMARAFNEAGIPSAAVTSRTSPADRRSALEALRSRDVKVVFTVDLFNEGVDVPEIDTVLFLRPTESATVFLQQLGRGLRLAEDKPCLTVLDFIGNQSREFRFDLRYRALTGTTRRGLQREIERGFPTLPAGCHLSLDRVTTDIVLANVRSSLRIDWSGLAAELRRIGDCTLSTFLSETGFDIDDIYRRRRGGWAGLRRAAGIDDRPPGDDDGKLEGAIGRMLHLDDLERLDFLATLLSAGDGPPPASWFTGRAGRLLAMTHFTLWGWAEPLDRLDAGLDRLWANPSRREEILDLLGVLRARIRRVTSPVSPGGVRPLHLHARYSLAELLAAFGVAKPSTSRGAGVRWIPEEAADVFWFNLRKTEKHFSPTTMYADRAISPTLFQWESQNSSHAEGGAGQRYIEHRERGSSVHLFFRETKDSDGDLGAPPYLYAGPASYVSHTGDRPLRILWKLDHDLPADVFHAARVATG
jgi:superfamily II DNA or RNA helicase/HKD family nuclease